MWGFCCDIPTAQKLTKMTHDGDIKWSLISLTATFLAVALLFVVFRFWARYTTAAKFGSDDWLIVAGLASQ